jgi:hypothetical protein
MRNHVHKMILILALAFALLFSGCGGAPEVDTGATAEAQTQEFNAVQQTAMMNAMIELTQTAAAQPPMPTDTPILPQTADTLPPLPTLDTNATGMVLPTNQSGVIPPTLVGMTATNPPPTGGDKAVIADETVKDGTIFAPGTAFTKTWTLRNVGTTTWTTDYAVVFIDGVQMNAADEVNLPISVPPGMLVDVSVNMRSPSRIGTYQGNWKLRNANGNYFGVGPDGQGVFWVNIVSDATPTPE